MPNPNEIIFIDDNQRFMFTPAKETSQAHMLVVPEGFTWRFRKAFQEWKACQDIINKLMTGQTNDTVVSRVDSQSDLLADDSARDCSS